MTASFDTIIVGTGFASSFFLASYLKQARSNERILVLERGTVDTHAWQLEHRRTSSIDAGSTFVNKTPDKPWIHNPSFGGGSNCWWAVTPRMMPNDFRLYSEYGVGVDWPISYDELEPYYHQAEVAMAVSGPGDGSPFPRSAPYPQPPHRFSDPDKLLKAAYPDTYFHQPTARARTATESRPACCASGVCYLCPIDAKFTILNEMQHLYDDDRVTLETGATVQTVETKGGTASGVTYVQEGEIQRAAADLIVLGANALFNPHILLRSNLKTPALGKYLQEQKSIDVIVDLDGVDNFQGSTSITGHGYMLYDGEHRSEHAGCLIEAWNVPMLRLDPGRWRQRLKLKFIFEALPQEDNYVAVNDDRPRMPETVFAGHGAYTNRGIERLPDLLPELLSPLPVEQVRIADTPNPTEAHILGTTAMGVDSNTSIVDRYLVHHDVRNLLVLGGGAFPTSAPANPTLTIAALSLWSAHHLFS